MMSLDGSASQGRLRSEPEGRATGTGAGSSISTDRGSGIDGSRHDWRGARVAGGSGRNLVAARGGAETREILRMGESPRSLFALARCQREAFFMCAANGEQRARSDATPVPPHVGLGTPIYGVDARGRTRVGSFGRAFRRTPPVAVSAGARSTA